MTIELHHGDSRDILKAMPDASVDSVCTDPPYALASIVKRFGAKGSTPPKAGVFGRSAAGFMGKAWDNGDTAFDPEFWAEVLRVLKPGGYIVAFGGTRTYHRLACAIEDAGFVVRDMISWQFGTGFPKSHNISKAIDKKAGATRKVVAEGKSVKRMIPGADQANDGWEKNNGREYVPTTTQAATDEARQWEGYGTALKPALEPICLAQKPLDGTIVENILKHGVGGLNIDGCRIAGECVGDTRDGEPSASKRYADVGSTNFAALPGPRGGDAKGRWPANVCTDGSDEVLAAYPDSDGQLRAVGPEHGPKDSIGVYGDYGPRDQFTPRADGGSAARFFFSAKADANDRWGSKHPTVKPVNLIRWLMRLITPPNGVVLDPFAGSGTAGVAALAEGFNAILIEREDEYFQDIRDRMAHYEGSGRHSGSQKARRKSQKSSGPLFGDDS